MGSNKTTTILVIVLVLAGLGFVYLYLGGTAVAQPITSGLTSSTAKGQGAQFIRALSLLKSIKFQDEVLEDELFNKLMSFTRPLTPEPVGKLNPFAPLEATQMMAQTIQSQVPASPTGNPAGR